MSDTRQHVQALIEPLESGQLTAVEGLLQVMVDPVARSLANAPFDDEPVSPEEAAAMDEACASLDRGEGIPHEEILREFGLVPHS